MKRLATSPNSLRVGDRVTWVNCPAHLESWQPFRVISIKLKTATAILDMLDQPVKLADLTRFLERAAL